MFWKKKQPLPEVSEVVTRITPTFADLSKWSNDPNRGHFDLMLKGPADIRIRLYDDATLLYDLSVNNYDITLNAADRQVIHAFVRRWLTYSVEKSRVRERELAAARDDALDYHLANYNL